MSSALATEDDDVGHDTLRQDLPQCPQELGTVSGRLVRVVRVLPHDEDAEAAEGPNSKRLVEVRDVLVHLDHPELEVRVLLARENIPGDQAIRSRANLGDLY